MCLKLLYKPVGWNWMNSMSWRGSPARDAIAIPSPVHVWAPVQEKKDRPAPPVAIIYVSSMLMNLLNKQGSHR